MAHLELFSLRGEGVDLHDLLEAVQADEDERVLQLGGRGLAGRHLVDEESVEGERLLVHHVLHAGDRIAVQVRRGRAPTRAPRLGQGGLL